MRRLEIAAEPPLIPREVSWIKLSVKEKDSRVTPENLLSKEEFEAIVKATDNPRDKALVYVLFEDALRSSELLTMNVGSVGFKNDSNASLRYCKGKVTYIGVIVAKPLHLFTQRKNRTC